MNEQAAGLGDAAAGERCARLPVPFVLVSGGKGGVGKTTLAANLGLELRRAHKRVLLVDFDLGLANLNVLLRLSVRRSVEDFLAGDARFSDCVVRGPLGVELLPAGSGSADMGRPDRARRARLFDALAAGSADYDVVVGDAAAGIGADGLAFALAAHRVLAVTTGEPAALTDAYGLVKALHAWGAGRGAEVPTPEVVVNLAASADDAESTAAKLRAVCERFLSRSPLLAGWLPRCDAVRRSAFTQRPFVLAEPDALSSRCVAKLARRVLRLAPTAAAAPASGPCSP